GEYRAVAVCRTCVPAARSAAGTQVRQTATARYSPRGSADNELALEADRARDVEAVRRVAVDGLVDLLELLGRSVALHRHAVRQDVVTRLDRGLEAEEAADVDVALGLDAELLERDALHR